MPRGLVPLCLAPQLLIAPFHHRCLYAFDLIELSGDDLRREPLEVRKATLKSVLAKAGPGLRLTEHIEADGPTVTATLVFSQEGAGGKVPCCWPSLLWCLWRCSPPLTRG
jgi:hypothetical protein